MAIFDDDGFGVDDFAFGLGFGEMIAEEERTHQRPLEDKEPLIDDEQEHWEKE